MYPRQTLRMHTLAKATCAVSESCCIEQVLVFILYFCPSDRILSDSKMDDAIFTNAIVDRASFKGSSLRGALFNNAVLTGTSFEGADVEAADFTDAAIGSFDAKNLCKNPTLKGENPTTGADTRLSVGCGPS
jgi:hypothetical protein